MQQDVKGGEENSLGFGWNARKKRGLNTCLAVITTCRAFLTFNHYNVYDKKTSTFSSWRVYTHGQWDVAHLYSSVVPDDFFGSDECSSLVLSMSPLFRLFFRFCMFRLVITGRRTLLPFWMHMKSTGVKALSSHSSIVKLTDPRILPQTGRPVHLTT